MIHCRLLAPTVTSSSKIFSLETIFITRPQHQDFLELMFARTHAEHIKRESIKWDFISKLSLIISKPEIKDSMIMILSLVTDRGEAMIIYTGW